MDPILIEKKDDIAVLRLRNGVTNAIGPGMLADMLGALDNIETDCNGLILAGGDKFFSMGFDLPRLLALERQEFGSFFNSFNQVVLRLFTLSIPTCGAIAGHAVAGGCILAQACDFRCSVPQKKLGLNEIRLGVPVPYLADLILRQLVGDRVATEMLYGGDFISSSECRHLGLVDTVCPPEEVEDKAFERVAHIAAFSHTAFTAIKANRIETVTARYEAHGEAKDDEFLDCWFTEATQANLRQAAAKF